MSFPLLAALVLLQNPTAPATTYTQMITRKDGTLEMQTAAQRLVADGKPDVWLVGAIHIGTKPYYASLQSLLNAQSSVMYEGVRNGPKPAEPPKTAPAGAAPAKPVYKMLSDAIGLEFQQTQITYDHPNWTNVDVEWAELERLNKAQSGGKPTQFDQVKGILDPNSPQAKQIAAVLGSVTPGMKEAIKILMIKAAGNEGTPGLDAATQQIILTTRNKTVVDALAAAFTQPAPPKSIAVLYGAKHLADLQKTLTTAYGYRLDEKRWFAAADADPKKLDAMGQTMVDQFEKMLMPKAPAKPPKALR
jgi:hypothetical protein